MKVAPLKRLKPEGSQEQPLEIAGVRHPRMDADVETLAIMTDRKLYLRLLKAADTLEEDIRTERLASFEEVFRENKDEP